MKKAFLLIIFSILLSSAYAQNWKLTRNENGVKIFQSETKSGYKNIKVETTIEGTPDKMLAVLTNMPKYKDWVYSNKTAYLLKKVSPTEFYYYSETTLPWPVDNRDAIAHVKIDHDKQRGILKVTEVGAPSFIPQKEGKVRVSSSLVTWTITASTPTTINIVYLFEANPGGNVPGWVINTFADKGPSETFKKLKQIMKNS